jgi:hypothetical protein
MTESEGIAGRKHERSEFAYPIEFKILSRENEHRTINGYIENVSESGSGILFEDKYGRTRLEGLQASRIKLIVVMPNGEKVVFNSRICWVRKDSPQPFFVQLGIEFEDIRDWQLEAIQKLVRVKNKDRNMMWNLWEQYEKQL